MLLHHLSRRPLAAGFPSVDNMASLPDPAPSPRAFPEIGLAHPAYRYLLARERFPHRSALTLGLLHKFNNLFTGTMFLTTECLTREQAGEPIGERLTEVLATLRAAHLSVSRIAQLHRDEEEEAGYHDLDAVIAEQLDLARLLLPRGTVLNHLPADERLTFYASQRALSEILLHLVGNCGEALPLRGGIVAITSRRHDRQAGSIAVEIRDNGPGFPAEILRQAFAPFGTTKDERQHLGLGLLRCRELARSSGGDLAVDNHPQGGAVVTLTLPRDDPQSN